MYRKSLSPANDRLFKSEFFFDLISVKCPFFEKGEPLWTNGQSIFTHQKTVGSRVYFKNIKDGSTLIENITGSVFTISMRQMTTLDLFHAYHMGFYLHNIIISPN